MGKKARIVITLLLCCLLIVGMIGCGKSNTPAAGSGSGSGSGSGTSAADSGAPTKDTVTIATYGDPGTLDPFSITGNGFFTVGYCMLETLFADTPGHDRQWILATSIDQISPTEYTIHLREGVTFSNGNPFTADDVLWTFQHVKEDPMAAMVVAVVDMEKTKKIDDYTINMVWSSYNFAQMGMIDSIMIADAESYNPTDDAPIGTGPYVLKEYIVNSSVSLTARDDYWGGPVPIKNVEFKVINEDAQKVTAIETGAVDVLKSAPTADAEYLATIDGYSEKIVDLPWQTMLQFNMTDQSIFKNQDARYAVCYATDRNAICNIAFDGFATPAVAPVSSRTEDFQDKYVNLEETYAHGYDLALAKEYAEKAGIVGQHINIVTNGESIYVMSAQVLMDALKEIGVEATLTNFDQAAMYDTLYNPNTGWDIVMWYTESPANLGADVLSGYMGFANFGAWSGPGYDAFMANMNELMASEDQSKRDTLFEESLREFETVCPWYGIADRQYAVVYSDKIKNFDTWLFDQLRPFDWSF